MGVELAEVEGSEGRYGDLTRTGDRGLLLAAYRLGTAGKEADARIDAVDCEGRSEGRDAVGVLLPDVEEEGSIRARRAGRELVDDG